MPQRTTADFDANAAPFRLLKNVQRLGVDRSGHASVEHVRHQLYIGRDKKTAAHALIKLTSKPGLVYEQTLSNEIASLSTINRELPGSPYFPGVWDHGRLRDGRVYLIMSLFDELPLAASIGPERVTARLVGHLRAAIEVARAVRALHALQIFHVDLNPMNILYRTEKGAPVIRVVDFESSYERARHSSGVFYNPPTTPGYCAPEVSRQAPDGRADVFSLAAVLYTMIAGFGWTWKADVGTSLQSDGEIDPELKALLLTAVDAEPDRRHASIEEFHAGLAAYLEHIWPGRSW